MVKSGESALLPEQMLKYAEESDKNSVCYRLEKDEVASRLEEVTADAVLLYDLAGSALGGFDEFCLLGRLLGDQTKNGQLVPNKEVSPKSLQNPSDEDATFRRKAGKGYQGYVANVVEDCGENGSIITQYDFQTNLYPDTEFGADVIENLGPQEERTVMITDGAFASEENFKLAEENNIELAATALTGQKPPEIIVDFEIQDNIITACPAGHAPI